MRYGKLLILCVMGIILFLAPSVQAAPLGVVCVETVWCDIAGQVGGDLVMPRAIIQAPDLNPHHLQPDPSMARQLAQADMVLLNGATYDDWALSLLPSSAQVLVAAEAAHWKSGQDSHLFFDSESVRAVAGAFAQWLQKRLPARKTIVQARLARLNAEIDRIETRISHMRKKATGQCVAVTEPAGQRVLQQLGLRVVNERWARAIMAGNGVSARETAALGQALTHRKVLFLVINPVVEGTTIQMVRLLARKKSIPLITIGETLLRGQSWQAWLNQILTEIETYLPKDGSVKEQAL